MNQRGDLMSKSFYALLVLILLQFVVSCASHHNERFPSSEEAKYENYRHPRGGGRGGR
jgi:hypothetical protein